MTENPRSCGRTDCSSCPRQRVGRCRATPEQKENHTCACGMRDRRACAENR